MLTTDPDLQPDLTPAEQQGLQTGVPPCPGKETYGAALKCIMQIFLFEADISLLDDARQFSRVNTAGEALQLGWEMMPKQSFEDHFEIEFLSADELTGPKAGDCESERRRMETAAVPPTSAAWDDEWRRRFECWWVALPLPSQHELGSCLGAFGLHLGSRLNTLMGTPARPLSPAVDEQCKWLQEGASQLDGLPDFPQPPHGFTLPALPRLIPSWERLQLLSHSREERQAAQTPQATPVYVSLVAGAGGALMALALGGALAIWCGRKGPRHSNSAAIASSNRCEFEVESR